MGRRQPLRQTFFFSLVATAISSAIVVWTDGGDWANVAQVSALFFVMIFFTMLATNRLSSSIAGRVAARQAAKAPPRGPATVAPTGERADHNQRRRQRADRARERRRR